MRAIAVLMLASLAGIGLVVLIRDPEEAWAVGAVVALAGTVAGALVSLLLLRAARGPARRVPPSGARAAALRRGAAVGVVTALLLWLRAIDGLSVVTAVFVVGTFVAAELVLAARPTSSR